MQIHSEGPKPPTPLNRDNALYTFGYTGPWLWRAVTSSRLAAMYMGRKVGTEPPPQFSAHILPSGILIYPAIWPQQIWAENWGPFGGGGAGPHVTQCGQGRGLPACQVLS